MVYFYDTNVLLQNNKKYFNQKQNFIISQVTLKELEKIKSSYYKDQNIKYKARKAIKWLYYNQDKYDVVNTLHLDYQDQYYNSPDGKIILDAIETSNKISDQLIFLTFDFSCYMLAKSCGLRVEYHQPEKQFEYKGFSKIYCNSDEQLANFYITINSKEKNDLQLNINEYLLVYDKDKILIDKYKYLGNNQFKRLHFSTIDSKMFGKIKPIDPYQQLAIDSLENNKLTLIKGAAGTGKSLLSMAYLFKALEQGDIDKIIIFCNTVATAGSAKLGYYPGDRTQKLLDSQIGNFLISKLGSRYAVQQMIDKQELLLLPMSDIRGFDTSGMRAGIYITEAQNLSVQLLKLALQRIGEDSICILDGDNLAQVDLNIYEGENNGLKRVSQVFKGQSFYGQISLQIIHRSKIANIASKM